MLELTELIGQGAFRACYKHPLTPGLCVKVFLPGKGSARQFKREIEVSWMMTDKYPNPSATIKAKNKSIMKLFPASMNFPNAC